MDKNVLHLRLVLLLISLIPESSWTVELKNCDLGRSCLGKGKSSMYCLVRLQTPYRIRLLWSCLNNGFHRFTRRVWDYWYLLGDEGLILKLTFVPAIMTKRPATTVVQNNRLVMLLSLNPRTSNMSIRITVSIRCFVKRDLTPVPAFLHCREQHSLELEAWNSDWISCGG